MPVLTLHNHPYVFETGTLTHRNRRLPNVRHRVYRVSHDPRLGRPVPSTCHESGCSIHRPLIAISGFLLSQRLYQDQVPTQLDCLRRALLAANPTPPDAAKPTFWGGLLRVLCRRSPNLPHTYACSTIGPTRLNFRVRDGNGCDPRGKLTGKHLKETLSRSFTTE